MITFKDSECKFFWFGNIKGTGGIGLIISKKWLDKILNVKQVNDRLMMIKILVGNKGLAIISTYAPHQGLSEDLISLVSKVGNDDLLVIGDDLNGHVGKEASGYQGIPGGFGYGSINIECSFRHGSVQYFIPKE